MEEKSKTKVYQTIAFISFVLMSMSIWITVFEVQPVSDAINECNAHYQQQFELFCKQKEIVSNPWITNQGNFTLNLTFP